MVLPHRPRRRLKSIDGIAMVRGPDPSTTRTGEAAGGMRTAPARAHPGHQRTLLNAALNSPARLAAPGRNPMAAE
jgi:hypothetical protein